jgi:hypothetical protein
MKKNDLYLIAGIILFVALAYALILAFRTEGSKVLITVDGKEHKTFNLNENTSYELINDGEYNIIEIKDGYVRMLEASCPDKICVKHGKIHYDNETITCLPNRVVVRVIGGEDSGLDTIAN